MQICTEKTQIMIWNAWEQIKALERNTCLCLNLKFRFRSRLSSVTVISWDSGNFSGDSRHRGQIHCSKFWWSFMNSQSWRKNRTARTSSFLVRTGPYFSSLAYFIFAAISYAEVAGLHLVLDMKRTKTSNFELTCCCAVVSVVSN